ncbi:MAG: prepilin-type N-terminal cleavage/methylation domain-containing protein [Chthoniobacteraceae bacterium]
MSTNLERKSGFTLLEVMLAVALLALVGMSIYRFVETTLTAVRISAEGEKERSLIRAFAAYLRAQMLALPSAQAGAITGEPHRFNNLSSDELSWIAFPGSGLLTRHATGEWVATLTAKQIDGGEYELGLRRQDINRKRDAAWLPLFRGVRGFEVRYFDKSRKEWMEKWGDLQTRPTLIRVKLWRAPISAPHEWIIPIPVKAQPAGGAS